jgi:hypothetical protein
VEEVEKETNYRPKEGRDLSSTLFGRKTVAQDF